MEEEVGMITKRYHFESIDSTNKKAAELAKKGCENGTLVTADAQEAGVGRRGRTWSSEKGAGIYMSMVLRPKMATETVSMVTLVAAMAVAKTFETLGIFTEKTPCIKWPNDIVMNKKKICGILTELALESTAIDYIIVGIGINVSNQHFPEEIRETASSIYVETGMTVDREALITSIWNQFKVYYDMFLCTQDFSQLKEEYETYLINKNQKVNVLDPAGNYEGTAIGITNKGELMVDTGLEQKLVSSGEVSVRGIYGYV